MSIKGNTDSIVVRFHSWIFIQSKESSDANSELFKEDDDEAMYKNPYEIRLCDLTSVSLATHPCFPHSALYQIYLYHTIKEAGKSRFSRTI